MKKLEVELKNGKKLVVEIYPAEKDICNEEICIGIENEDGVYTQDIACIRESIHKENIIETLVWSDTYDEDFTAKFETGIWEEEVDEDDN